MTRTGVYLRAAADLNKARGQAMDGLSSFHPGRTSVEELEALGCLSDAVVDLWHEVYQVDQRLRRATGRPLPKLLEDGTFMPDYRQAGLPVQVRSPLSADEAREAASDHCLTE
jgi:hypothetical protein